MRALECVLCFLLASVVQGSSDAMLRVIEEQFQGITGGSADAKAIDRATAGDAWKECAMVDYSSFAGLGNDRVQTYMKQVGLSDLCSKGDASCAAFKAGFKTIMALRELDEAPRFQNCSLVNWLQSEAGFSSWGSEPGQVGKVDYSVQPPAAAVPYKHAGDGFALCQFTQVILKQNDKQLANDCGPTGVLAALTIHSPAEAFKASLQLYYTGKLPGMDTTPCPYVYEQQPGLIPYKSGQPGYGDFPSGTDFCPGAMHQQEGQASAECQNIGIHQMWVTTLLDTYEQKMRLSAGLDNGCHRSLYGSLHPLQNLAKAQLTRDSMLVGAAAIVYFCQVTFHDHCKFLSPAIQNCMKQFDLGEEACVGLVTSQDAAPSDVAELTKAYMAGQDVVKLISQRPTLSSWLTRLPGTSWTEKPSHAPALLGLISTPSPDRKATVAMMRGTCSAKESILIVAAGMLDKAQGCDSCDIGQCNHAITLKSCGHNEYHIWTWGMNLRIKKDLFHQGVCGAVTHKADNTRRLRGK